MGTPWQFWPGHNRNYINPAADHYRRVVEANQQKEAELASREQGLGGLGESLAAQHGLKFIGTRRRHPDGTSIPKNPKLGWSVPPKSVIELGFEVAPAGVAGWRVRERLAPGVILSGKNSTGWNVWIEEKDLGDIGKIFKTPVLPPVEERNREQSDGTLTNFGGHYRVMGATRNAQFWVIQPDGSLREPDEHEGRGYRQKYKGTEGNKRWNVVTSDELAISWFKSCTAAAHQCEINKLPVNGCTAAQLETVARLEQELNERFRGHTGLASGEPCPDIGQGWNLSVCQSS